LHENVHALLTQTPLALATAVVHTWPQLPQLAPSLVVSTQLPLQSAGAVEGQPDTQEYEPPAPAQTGFTASAGHAAPQVPQLAAVEYWTHAPLHMLYPLAHAKVHVPSAHAACVLGTVVSHALPHVPQFAGAVRSTQPPSHGTSPAAQPAPPSIASKPSSASPSATPDSTRRPLSLASPDESDETEASGALASPAAASFGVVGPPSEPSGAVVSTVEPDAHPVTTARAPAMMKTPRTKWNRWRASKLLHVNSYPVRVTRPDETSRSWPFGMVV
jgi:hypothetical protein